jgi:CheY-like chemotaxis protein
MGIAHEFNNILMGISGYAQLASASPQDQAIVEKACRIILQQSERAGALIRRLAGFGRRHPHTPRATAVAEVMNEVIALQEKELRQDQVEIRREYSQSPQIWADPDQLQQVFFNLFLNARYAVTPGKGVIIIRATKKGEMVEIRVSDNGVGIEAGDMPKLFTPFFTTKIKLGDTRVPSLGLGLWVSRQIVEEHGGTIRAESASGQGATFIVTLPRAPAAKPKAPQRKNPAPHRRDFVPVKIRVLVVDDERGVVEVFQRYLEGKAFQVSTASDGKGALELCRRSRFDVILLDYLMPGMHGKELIGKLKTAAPDSIIFMITGQLISEDERRDIGSLVNDWLFKPVELGALEDLIRRSCQHSPPGKKPGK